MSSSNWLRSVGFPDNIYYTVKVEPTQLLSTADKLSGVNCALAFLSEREELAVRLRYQNYLLLKEMADELDVSISRARNIYAVALKKLLLPRPLLFLQHGGTAGRRLYKEKYMSLDEALGVRNRIHTLL